jgi:predicted extracellular nuclease
VLVLGLWSCGTAQKGDKHDSGAAFRVGFYNVENLFDTENDPTTQDDDFTPEGKLAWTPERYVQKLKHLEQVLAAMEFPLVLGMCEVENGRVLTDLVGQPLLKDKGYDFVHFDSPDERGIDVALLYRKKEFTAKEREKITIQFPTEVSSEADPTRDIVKVCGELKGFGEVCFFMNHFPSRRGGAAQSEPKRMYVAQQLRAAVQEVMRKTPRTSVLILGDFNDEPYNNSMTQALGAATGSVPARFELYNLMSPLKDEGAGSYYYKGDKAWNLLDQIIASEYFVHHVKNMRASIFSRDFMMYTSKADGVSLPSHTYDGNKYYGGYSDHLPVLLDFQKQ